MKTAIATLESISPYSQSRYHEEPKKEKEAAGDYEERTWRSRMHINNEGYVYIPPITFKKCLEEAAKYLAIQIPGKGKSQYTKHFEAGVIVEEPIVLPIKAKDVQGEWLFMFANGKNGSRVMRCYPIIPQWGGDVTFHIADDTITEDIFKRVLEGAGMFVGIGRWRPRNRGLNGRFIVKSVKWIDQS